ncbi:MAG TPA: type I DNA topoisomerase [Fimbriimonadaceae bacterium]|nr:type I DNA topoisomerase [Fimbriimonadaceae bacterium]
MAKKLVIVESPAKAKTIGSYLGKDYEVQASVGHIRDLPANGRDLPESLRKKWWADYAVDVDQNFEPIYEVPKEKAGQVKKLREALKGKDTLVLATDEDREGESISWHLLQVLKPPKTVDVRRIAFHEITREAILDAMQHPRRIDEKLVEAQETRRILDRLYGYTLSPVLWRLVTTNLSAGRVQSPAVKLIVEREIQRRNFRSGTYWGLRADLEAAGTSFPADLRSIDGRRVATGADFDDTTGQLKSDKVILLDEARAKALADACRSAKPWTVRSVTATEGQERPAPPFMTTTLQQDANRKFGYSADRTMRIAQTLYEGVEIGGEQIGLITYMRTDSLTLSSQALANIRGHIAKEYPDCLPDKAVPYTSKVRNAQEAHEAIRPTDVSRRPADIARYLNEDQRKIYELIWKRTVACQMKPARVLKTEAEIDVAAGSEKLVFRTTGKQILFDGFRRVYMEGQDEESEREGERRLPTLKEGMEVGLQKVEAAGHETKPPARYTDATLIKRLEELGIGRPSTYASIIAVIVDRGYVRKSGKQLIPTFKAFLTMEVLESGFHEFMELGFTARMDEALDEISEGKCDPKQYLREFFLGAGQKPGLKKLVDERRKEIPFPTFAVGKHPDSGEAIIVRNGRDGHPFLQAGDEANKKYANIPEDMAPADLTVEKAVELLNQKSAPAESVGIDPVTGRRLLVKQRAGYYLEAERTPEEIERKEKPRWISLPPSVNPHDLSQEDLDFLCKLPRVIGQRPETGEDITYRIGKFGPYIQAGSEIRNVEDWRAGLTMTVEQADEILKLPKGARAKAKAAGPIQEFGQLEGAAGPVKVLAGRFGPYVTDGETNATLPKAKDPATITAEEANELLVKKREAGPSKRFVRRKQGKAKTAKPKAAKKPATKRKAK